MSDNTSLVKILVVEDESIIAQDIQNMLERFGYAATPVSSGEEAIKKSAEMHPDLVLMDIKLNGNIDGIEAAKQICTRFNIPVVYLITSSENGILERVDIIEPFNFILKPVKERELLTVIRVNLYRNKMEKELKLNEEMALMK